MTRGRQDATDKTGERFADLEARLRESEETLDAIRRNEIDALVVSGVADGPRVFTLEGADRTYRILVEQMQEGAVTLGQDGRVLYCNQFIASLLGDAPERVVGQKLQRYVLAEDAGRFARLLGEAGQTGARGELTLRSRDGRDVPVYLSLSLLHDDETAVLCGVLTDLTEQKLHLRELTEANARLTAEMAERGRVEDALRQAHKMEAVGQLTGGLAHDFNNLLTGIFGNLELLQARIAQGRIGEVDRYVTAARGAATRAAALTHRLLAFSRHQTLAPVPTNANRLVTGLEELIQRTVGPAIAVKTVLTGDLWPTLCDPNQLESALLNLSINARDAMPDGGSLTIGTANVRLDERAAGERDMAPGHYVTVCVSDTGTGMPPDVAARAFDPFFTTKPIDKGTGLGLSMIYGFARQSGGHVRIHSHMGSGTTVRLYLPRHAAEEASDSVHEVADGPFQAEAGQVVLVVDDDTAVLTLVSEVLGDLGYGTIEAGDGPSGLEIVDSDARIDLLITDVGLPGGMNGREVANAVRARRPGLKVLFITGYGENAAIGTGRPERGTDVLTKPFSVSALAAKVQAMLGDHLLPGMTIDGQAQQRGRCGPACPDP
jgi:PAS domain S-box-containing protein